MGLLDTLSDVIAEQIKWNEDVLRDIAKKYNSRVEFRNSNSPAYRAALRIDKQKPGFFDDITSHMQILWKKKWNYENILNVARKYKTKLDFRQNEKLAYGAALDHGYIEKITDVLNWSKPNSWTKENIAKVAKQYETKVDFVSAEPSAYQIAWRNKWLDDVTQHMIPVGNLVKRMIYAWEFPDKTVYVGLTGNKKKREWAHMNNPKSPVYRYSKENNLTPKMVEITDKYIDAADAQAEEENTKLKYIANGWKVLNKSKTGGLGGNIIKWTPEEVQKEAKKYLTKVQFQNEAPGAYNASKNLGIYDKVTEHMEWMGGTQWTYDMLEKEAKKYNTRTDFFKNNQKAYSAAQSRGILDDITKHMEWMGGEQWSWDKILEKVKNYTKYKDFSNDFPGAATWVRNNNLTDELKKIIKYDWEQKWNYDRIKKEALKYKTKNEFTRDFPGATHAAKEKGWWDDVTSHMSVLRNDYKIDDAVEIVSRYENIKDFRSEHPNLYAWAHREKLLPELTKNLKRSNVNWTPELINQELQKYQTYSEFKKNSRKAYDILRYRKNLQLARDFYTKN